MTLAKRNTSLVERTNLSPIDKKAAAEKIERMKEEDLRMVKGIFKNLECPNGCVKFFVRKYKGEPVRDFLMWDGKEYEVPLYVAKNLNNGCCYPVHAWSVDPEGKPLEIIGKMVNRFAFISMDFR